MKKRRDYERVANIRARGRGWERDFKYFANNLGTYAPEEVMRDPVLVEELLQGIERNIKGYSRAFSNTLLAMSAMDDD
jgi:hypothetical protein